MYSAWRKTNIHESCSLSDVRRSVNRTWRSGLRTSVTFLHTSVTFLHTSVTFLHTAVEFLHTSVTFLLTSVAFLDTSVAFLHALVTFLHNTLLRIAHTVLVVCGKTERHSDCRKETIHGRGSEFTAFATSSRHHNSLSFSDAGITSLVTHCLRISLSPYIPRRHQQPAAGYF